MRILVRFHEAEEGGYWAEVPALRGCRAQGETMDEVKNNIIEAINGWLAVAAQRGQLDPRAIVEEVEV
jgi:predicted RNase H-like HicB family nuclease